MKFLKFKAALKDDFNSKVTALVVLTNVPVVP